MYLLAALLIVMVMLFFGAMVFLGVVLAISGEYLTGVSMILFGVGAPICFGDKKRMRWIEVIAKGFGPG